jgi:hypothetical protein
MLNLTHEPIIDSDLSDPGQSVAAVRRDGLELQIGR